MDIVEWDEDPKEFIKNALNPADVVEVYLDEESRECTAVVPDMQLSLAIGRRGQNVRLAARLTGYKIDIKSEEDFDPTEFIQAQAEKDMLEEGENLDVSTEVTGETVIDNTDEFFDSLEETDVSTDTDALEDAEDFFEIFDDQHDEDTALETEALETDQDELLDNTDIVEEVTEEPVDSVDELSVELEEIDQELAENDEE